MAYPEEMVAPMREEVAALGVKEVRTGENVRAEMARPAGTALWFINSVCGCAAGTARPGLAASLSSGVLPDRLYTVFAGNDTEAVAEVRGRIIGYPPSSPFFALFKDGDLVAVIERHEIQGLSAEEVGVRLAGLYAEHCSRAPA